MSKLPRPLFNQLILKNPLFGKVEEMRDELAKLPEKAKAEYIQENVLDIFDKVEVVAIGKSCAEVKEGDIVMVSPDTVKTGIQLNKGEYVIIRESNLLAIW